VFAIIKKIEIGAIGQAVIINEKQVVLNSYPSKDHRKSSKAFTFDFCFDSSSTSDHPNYACNIFYISNKSH